MTDHPAQTITIDPALLDPNPFQPKTRLVFTPDQLADLSSIKDLGFIQRPQVRMHSTQRGRYQIKVGHRRCAAWQLYRPGEPIPVDLIVADDRAMFEHMIVENLRTDPNAIERAIMIRDYMQRFNVTQAQAAPLFGLKNQASVSNLLKLLALPVDVQPLVNDAQVPQRIARTFIALGRVAPKAVSEIMRAVADAKEDDKEDVAYNELDLVVHKHATAINLTYLDVKWQPLEPITIDGQPATPPACVDCEYHVQARGHYCTSKACLTAKIKAFPAAELVRVSLQFGIPIAVPADGAKPLDVSYQNENRIKGWLNAKHRPAHLRVMPNPHPSYSTLLSDPLGRHVLLASTEPDALKEKKKDQPKPDRAAETPAARAKRIAAEEIEAEQRREERSAARRVRADVTWLVQQLTLDTAAQLKIEGGILELAAADVAHGTYTPTDWVELANFAKSIHGHKDDTTRKQYIVFKLLLRAIWAYKPKDTFVWSRATSRAEGVVTRDLGLKLQTGWNKPPIHHTSSNCWACGKFTPGSTITGVDRANGWTVSGNDGSVACSNPCRAKLLAAPEGKPAKKAIKK